MAAATIRQEYSVEGRTFLRTAVRTADGATVKDPAVPAARAGTLTTRTDDNTGVFAFSTGHGFALNDRVDVYWTGGKRVGMNVTAVSGNDVTLDAGSGDNLPLATTAVGAMEPQLEVLSIVTAAMQMLFVSSPVRATAVFRDSGGTALLTVEVGPNNHYVWETGYGSNPLGSNAADVFLSHGDTASAQVVTALALVN